MKTFSSPWLWFLIFFMGLTLWVVTEIDHLEMGIENKMTKRFSAEQDLICASAAMNLQRAFLDGIREATPLNIQEHQCQIFEPHHGPSVPSWFLCERPGLTPSILLPDSKGKIRHFDVADIHRTYLKKASEGLDGNLWVMSPSGVVLIDDNLPILGKNIFDVFSQDAYKSFRLLRQRLPTLPAEMINRSHYDWLREDGRVERRIFSSYKTKFFGRDVLVCASFGGEDIRSFLRSELERIRSFLIVGSLVLAIILIASVLVRRQQSRAKLEKDRLSGFLSPSVVKQVLNHQLDLKAGPRPVSIIFIDLRHFTSISETLGAEATSRLLCDFYQLCTDMIFKYGGTVDKYIGDSVMAFFGAPDPLENHAQQSVSCAQEILDHIGPAMEKWKSSLPISCGISIASGISMVGPIGVETKTDYTVIGPIVNLASRMEGLNKRLNSELIICNATREALGPTTPFESVGPLEIRGIQDNQMVHVYRKPDGKD